MNKIISIICVLTLLLGIVGCKPKAEKNVLVTIYNSSGEVIAGLTRFDYPDSDLADKSYRTYVDMALKEAITVLQSAHLCDAPSAAQKLFENKLSLHTALNKDVHTAVSKMSSYRVTENLSVACSVVDLNGNVLAAINGGKEAQEAHAPYSTIKPLAVYAPAIEKGVLSWSTTIEDKPYKQLPNKAGVLKDWPENPTNEYTYKETLLLECIKQSLNTASVHALKKYGVQNSLNFLKESFDLTLDYEQNALTLKGDEEIIGNLALGHLYTGLSPTQLAGCYQIFGNGGKYTAPVALLKILRPDGSEVYSAKRDTRQVISEETAYIMNRLLCSVVEPGGTGDLARSNGAELIGKTGTGDTAGGNWFVGVTPEYSCAVWHGGKQASANYADSLFSEVMANMPAPTVEKFTPCSKVKKGVFCSESGDLFGTGCKKMHVGYYASNSKPSGCTSH